MHADQILVLDKGRIVQQGRHRDLKDRDGLYRDVFRIQSDIESELQNELARGHGGPPIHSCTMGRTYRGGRNPSAGTGGAT